MAYQIHLFLVLPLKAWTGNKAEVYNVRQIPALHICINRPPNNYQCCLADIPV